MYHTIVTVAFYRYSRVSSLFSMKYASAQSGSFCPAFYVVPLVRAVHHALSTSTV